MTPRLSTPADRAIQPIEQVNGTWVLFGLGNVLSNLPTSDRWPAASQDAAVVTVAASSFVGTSVFALSGMALGNPAVSFTEVLAVIPTAVLYDVALTPFVLPVMMRLFRRLEPHQVAY